MKRLFYSFFIVNCTILFSNILTGQNLTFEVPLIDQVQSSSQIVEGKVISKASYWDTAQEHIYTANTVEVYKVFKGSPTTYVEIITPGGTVGLSAEIVTPSLDLYEGDTGMFMLQDTDVSLERQASSRGIFAAYSSSQGFYKYDLVDNKAVNEYKVKNGITQTFYSEIVGLTNQNFVSVKAFDIDEIVNQNTSSENNRQPIFSIVPLVTTAGTQSVITISGTAFGATQGTVSFANADNGGATFTPALDSQVLSWSDTEIVVEVPRQAGTGRVRVTTNSGGVSTSNQDITVLYAELNVVSSGVAYPTRHINQNGNGGMTWQMQIDFDGNAAAKASFLRAFDTWVCESGVNWINGSVTTIDAAVLDGVNIVRFDNGSELPNGVLGRNTSYWAGCNSGGLLNWFVNELDIVFNDSTNWQFGPANPIVGQFDFETTAVHELGHGHQLGHVIDPAAIMHYATGGAANRILSQNDIDGANDIQFRSVNDPVCGNDPMTNSDCSLSISDEEFNQKIVIYPLPAKDNIYIESAFDLNLKTVELIDAQGRLVSTIELSQNSTLHTLNLEAINSGIYFLKITTATNAQLVKKIVVE
ncbi:T9SS type A sorting domain-containing protein [Winogradskyella aurantia]|uniref:Secretion system C-terminal sorting domain-containing protein n=1 Tax=Winogradskyella aurantia TaxID=1915063 RepID=A0A265V085_9FLAO|nr:T9SS type A sorting domain-containing protein [Winogradskyella aurantia]OZV70971.1 hypothetical protein CA834_02320 [Winogradskyella aurantia]